MDTTAPRRLSLFEFTLACEELEGLLMRAFEAAQRAAKKGDVAEVCRQEKIADAASSKLDALIAGQLAARGEKAPVAPDMNAPIAA
jgi:hypothetical protein